MSTLTERIELVDGRTKVMHRTVRKAFSVRIDFVNGSPPDALPPNIAIEMHKMRGGVIPTLAAVTNFLSMTRGQCTPVGSIRARIRGLNSANVDYTVEVND